MNYYLPLIIYLSHRLHRLTLIFFKTKTKKTPSVGLKLILSICAKRHDCVSKNKLLSLSHTTYHNH